MPSSFAWPLLFACCVCLSNRPALGRRISSRSAKDGELQPIKIREMDNSFHRLQQFHNISLDELLSEFPCFSGSSECGGGNLGAGQSSASFMLSTSKRFFAKTIEIHEWMFFERFSHDYVDHMIANPTSLMSIILTAFKLKGWLPCVAGKNCWMIMNNALGERFYKKSLGGKFDLKGVWTRQDMEVRGLGNMPWNEPDGIEEHFADRGIFLSPTRGHDLLERLRADTKFLAEQHLMDYSLLVQVEELGECDDKALKIICQNVEHATSTSVDPSSSQCPVEHSSAGRKSAGVGVASWLTKGLFADHSGYAVGVRGNVIYSYSIGLIDFLASWHIYQVGGWIGRNVNRKDNTTLELVEPWNYRERLLSYVQSKVISEGVTEQSPVRDPTCECSDLHHRSGSATPCVVARA